MSEHEDQRDSLPEDHFPAVVIGSGLAGLTAAAHLAAGGVPPLVLEADALWPGGRCSGGEPDIVEHGGQTWHFTPDHGMHALWGGYVNLRATLERFTEVQLMTSPGEEWINRWGREVRRLEAGNAVRSRWLPAPFHHLQLLFHPQIWSTLNALDFLSLPGLLASIFLTIGVDPIRERRAWDGLLMKEYFRGWTPNLRATFVGLGRNLLAAPDDEIDLAAFIAAMRFYTMLRRDAWAMHYLPGDSHHALVQPLLDHIDAHEGLLFSGATAVELQRLRDGWRVVVEDSRRGGYRSLATRHVVLATDVPGAQRLLCHSADTSEAASRLIFPAALRDTVVRLWFDAAPREGTPGGMLTGHFVPDNFFWLHRLRDEHRLFHLETGGSAIELHFYAQDDVLDLPEQNLIIIAVDEVTRAFPELRGHFLQGSVRANSKLQTRFRVPTAESLHVQTPWPGLVACGDWIGHETPSFWMERAATTGIAAANEVLAAQGCPTYPVLMPPPPELPVRVLGGALRGMRRVFGPGWRWLGRQRARRRAQEA